MRNNHDYERDKHATNFKNLTWFLISEWLDGAEFISNEIEGSSRLQKMMDMYSGVDAFVRSRSDNSLIPIACRIQYTNIHWNSFTIRLGNAENQGELFKRLASIEGRAGFNSLYPAYTFQAYVSDDNGSLRISIGMAKTKELIEYAAYLYLKKKNLNNSQYGIRRSDVEFFYVKWDLLESVGADRFCFHKAYIQRPVQSENHISCHDRSSDYKHRVKPENYDESALITA